MLKYSDDVLEEIRRAELVDDEWYLSTYQDVAALGMDPLEHYLWIGRTLRRKPSSALEPAADLLSVLLARRSAFERGDVALSNAAAGPASNFHLPVSSGHGSAGNMVQEARVIALASAEPFAPLFDADYYWNAYADCRDSGLDPWTHFLRVGRAELRKPNEFFSPAWYLAKHPDVAAAGLDPLDHYARFGVAEGRECSDNFCGRFYRMQLQVPLPDGSDPLAHFLAHRNGAPLLPHASATDETELKDRIGLNEVLQPTEVSVGIVLYRQSKSEVDALVASAEEAFRNCGSNVTGNIMMFDNGGTFTIDDVKSGVDLRWNGRNDGFGRSHNYLMAEAFNRGADCYIGANPDGVFHPESVKNLLKMSQRHRGAALIEAVQFPEEHPKFYHPSTLQTDWCSGACFLLPKTVWEEAGGFDESFFLYCEDVDLSWNVRLHGFETLTCPSALYFHDVSGREYSPRIWKEMLIAGRYLAHKWGSSSFQKYVENELLSHGFIKNRKELKPLSTGEVIADVKGIPDFSKLFSFTRTRW